MPISFGFKSIDYYTIASERERERERERESLPDVDVYLSWRTQTQGTPQKPSLLSAAAHRSRFPGCEKQHSPHV